MLTIKDVKAELKPIVRKWINAKEACEYIGCKATFLKNLRDNNLVVYSSLGGNAKGRSIILYRVDSLDRYIESCQVNNDKLVNASIRCSS